MSHAEANIMLTAAEMFEAIADWHQWNGADRRARELEAEGHHGSAAEYRALRDRLNVDPVEILSIGNDLIKRVTASRWDAITEARLRGVSWDQIAVALNEHADSVRNEYIATVDWCSAHRPECVDLERYRYAC